MSRSLFSVQIFSILLTGLVIVPQTFASFVVTENGVVIDRSSGQVLGDKSNNQPNNNAREQVKVEAKTKTQSEELGKIKTTLKIKVKDDQLELESDGDVETENEYEVGEQTESTPSGSLEIEDRSNKNKTKVRAQDNAAYVIRNKIAAQTHFPLMVNLETNELIVTTPKGTKVVTVLPDAAVQHMLTANVLDQLGGKGGLRWLEYQQKLATPSATPIATSSAVPTPTDEATPSATPIPSPTPEVAETVDNVIILTTNQDGALVYEIQGSKNKKLLGFKPIELQRTVIVSAETGELVQIVQDLKTRVLDLLSV